MTVAPAPLPDSGPARAAAWALAAAGTLPFFAGIADASVLGRTWLGAVHIYAAVIASFVCGIHWGAALFSPGGMALRLFVASNVAALLAWGAALLSPRPGFLLLAAVFAGLLLVDRQLRQSGLWPGWFWTLRVTISTVVIGACLWIGMAA